VLTVLATVLAAPLLIVEIAPGADATPDASLAAYHEQVAEESGEASPEPEPTGPGRAVGALSAADVVDGRILGTLSVGDELRAQAEADALDELAEAARADEAAAAAAAAETTTTTAPPPPPPPPPAPSPGGPTAAQWAALRNCESGGNYAAISANGLYFGAYQFHPGTWDSTASYAGRGDLVGVRPDHAAPSDQDAMARALYDRRGSSPWPHCGRHLN
jgi:hypothetical protein